MMILASSSPRGRRRHGRRQTSTKNRWTAKPFVCRRRDERIECAYLAEDERRSPEVALGVIGRALSRGPSPTRESASSGPVQKINSTLIDIDVTSARWRGRARLSSLSILTRWSICAGRPKGVWPAALASYLIFRRSLGGRRRPASRPPRRALRRAPRPPRRRRRRAAPSAPETRSDLMSIFSNAVAATNCLAAHRHQSSQSNENQYYTRAAALLLRNK